MEWGKVKTVLIVVLLAVNVILGGNLFLQVRQRQQAEEGALLAALAMAESRGVTILSSEALQLPVSLPEYSSVRMPSLEQDFSAALLGAVQAQEAGGGVTFYTSVSGSVSFRRGGALEIVLPGDWRESTDQLLSLLEEAGLDLSHAIRGTRDGVLTLRQTVEDYISDNVLQCSLTAEQAVITGRWLLGQSSWQESDDGCSRAEAVLAIAEMGQQAGGCVVKTITPCYVAQNISSGETRLVPVWQVETDQDTFLLDIVSKKRLGN